MERNCWYCHKPLPLTKLLKKDLFCSTAHEEQYFSDQTAAAFARMKEPEPSARMVAKSPDPAAVELLPVAAEAEQPPPPMAPLLELLPQKASPPVLVPEQDPITPVGTPAPPRGDWTRVEPELAMNGWIGQGTATPPPLAGIEGGFAELPFESNVALPVEPAPSEPVASPSPTAPSLPIWTVRAAADFAMDEIASAPSIDAEQSPRVPGVEANPPAHFHSNPADGNPHLAPVAGSAPVAFVSAPDQLSQAEPSPRIAGVEGYPHAYLRSNSADGTALLAAIARSAPLMFVSEPAFQECHRLPEPEAWSPNPSGLAACGTLSPGWSGRLERIENPTAFAADFEQREGHLSKGDAPASKAPRVPRSPRMWFAWDDSRAAGIENRVVFVADFEHRDLRLSKSDAPTFEAARFLSPAPAIGAWDNSLPVVLKWQPIIKASSWTNTHNPANAVRSTWEADAWRHGARPAHADFQEIMAGANGWSVILSPAPVDELAFEGTLRIPDAHSEIAALSPVEAGANLRSSLIPRDSQTVSIAPTDSATSTLGADFQAFSFTPVPRVAFAGATSLQGRIADSSLPALIHANQSEPSPASLMAKPRTSRPGAPTLHSGARADHPWQAVPGNACEGPAPSLDREGARAFRVPKTTAANPSDPALRVPSGIASTILHPRDAAAKPYLPTEPPVRIDPASIFAPPAWLGMARLARIGGSPAQFRFFAMRKLVAVPFHGVLRAAATPAFSNSIGSTQSPGGLKLRPLAHGPGHAAPVTLDVPLQQVAYERGRRVAKRSHL